MNRGETPPICPYCNKEAVYRDTKIIYGKSYGMAWICPDFPSCDSYVGVHKGTKSPLGRMANRELRNWKQNAHAVFDPLWKSKTMKRHEAYALLSELMGLPKDETHIGMFDVDQCKQVIEVIKQWRSQNRRKREKQKKQCP